MHIAIAETNEQAAAFEIAPAGNETVVGRQARGHFRNGAARDTARSREGIDIMHVAREKRPVPVRHQQNEIRIPHGRGFALHNSAQGLEAISPRDDHQGIARFRQAVDQMPVEEMADLPVDQEEREDHRP